MNTYAEVSQEADRVLGETEGPIAKAIEMRTARLPSDLFLWAAGASIVASFVLEVMGMERKRRARGIFGLGRPASQPLAGFVGMWAPTFLLLGLYNKLVKVAGSDRAEH